jgi:hypothetical protein
MCAVNFTESVLRLLSELRANELWLLLVFDNGAAVVPTIPALALMLLIKMVMPPVYPFSNVILSAALPAVTGWLDLFHKTLPS